MSCAVLIKPNSNPFVIFDTDRGSRKDSRKTEESTAIATTENHALVQ